MTRAGRRALASLGLLLLLADGAAAQPPAGHGGLPSGEGTSVGRVVQEADGRAAPGQDVVLYTVGADGAPGLSSAVTDADGTFRFEGLAADPAIVYLVGSRSGAVPFGSRVTFAEGQRQLDVELRIAPLSGDSR